MSESSHLSAADKKQYRSLLSKGEFKKIHSTFGEDHYKRALVYIAKKSASEWMHLLEVGFPTPQTMIPSNKQEESLQIQTPGKKRVTPPILSTTVDKRRKGEAFNKKKDSVKEKRGQSTKKELVINELVSATSCHPPKKNQSNSHPSANQSHSSKNNQSTSHPPSKKNHSSNTHPPTKRIKAHTKPTIPIQPTFDNPIPLYPRKRVPYKTAHAQFKLGDTVRFILPAYQDFLQQHTSLLPQDTITAGKELIQQYQSLSLSTVVCKVTGVEIMYDIADDVFSVTLRSTDQQILSVVVMDMKSPLLQTAPHLIQESAYSESMKFLQVLHSKFNGILTKDPTEITSKITKITQIFALPQPDQLVAIEGEVYEGMVYDVNEDALENPYQSIHVIWYGKSMTTGKWVMDFFQLDNDASPWDLTISTIACETPEQEQIIRSPVNPDLNGLLNLLRNEEGISIFEDCSELASLPQYNQVISNPIDFKTIQQKLDKKEYEGEKESSFWVDLGQIVSNAKTFNQRERFEWRVADILEAAIKRIQNDIQCSRIRYQPKSDEAIQEEDVSKQVERCEDNKNQ